MCGLSPASLSLLDLCDTSQCSRWGCSGHWLYELFPETILDPKHKNSVVNHSSTKLERVILLYLHKQVVAFFCLGTLYPQSSLHSLFKTLITLLLIQGLSFLTTLRLHEDKDRIHLVHCCVPRVGWMSEWFIQSLERNRSHLNDSESRGGKKLKVWVASEEWRRNNGAARY